SEMILLTVSSTSFITFRVSLHFFLFFSADEMLASFASSTSTFFSRVKTAKGGFTNSPRHDEKIRWQAG
ncbi:UNVERIFIED_CONTAM: hypothetical protein NY603_38490, partial [Bacteroidetes bacterium 56_B9]